MIGGWVTDPVIRIAFMGQSIAGRAWANHKAVSLFRAKSAVE